MNALHVAERSAVYALEDAAAPAAGEAFDLLATAPQGVAKMRELILSLAVRGRLVPQIASEGTATTLLKMIDEHRARLIARGEAKRGKPLPPVAMNEPPFEIPSAWVWVRLGEATNFGATDKATRVTDDTWVLDLEDIEKDTSKLLRRVRFEERRSLSAKNVFQRGDVLYGKLRPYLNKVIVADQTGVCTTEILPFRCFGPYDPSYFRFALQSSYFLNYVNGKSYGMKMPRLGTEDGRLALVPIPPLAEQRRIVARVEELMGLCDELETRGRLQDEQHARLVATLFDALVASTSPTELADNWQRIASHFDLLLDRPAAVDALEQTILQLAVRGLLVPQDPSDEPASALLTRNSSKERATDIHGLHVLPDGWQWTTVEGVASVGTGTTPSRTNPAYFSPASIPWVTSGETGRPFIDKTEQGVSPLALRDTSLKVYPSGTLIVAMYGQGKTRGQVSELRIEATTNQACAAIVPTIADVAHRRYLKLFFEKIYDEIRELSAGGAQPNLNVGKVKATLVPLPPLAEQHRIVARVEELRSLCADLRQHLQQAQTTQSNLADALVARTAA